MEKFTYETVKSYQSFASLEEMNEEIRRFLYRYKSTLSNGAIKVIQYIAKHSCKVIGVSFSKNQTIASALNLGVRTVTRSIKKFVDIGLLKKIHTVRENGKQGVNILVIQPFSTKMTTLDDHVCDHPNKTEKKLDSLCENKKPFIEKEENATTDTTPPPSSSLEKKGLKENPYAYIDSTFLPPFVHPEFIKVADPFFSAMEIFQLWKRVTIAYNKIPFDRPLEELIDAIIQSFKTTIFMHKTKKIHSTFAGYFYNTLYANFIVEKRKENYEEFMFDVFLERLERDGGNEEDTIYIGI
ncbi:hypothetical protein [Bacillus sp. FJAT-45066]|uniref:hypothetical protein n=1 Tax=Bacillus sp. FJAT-45066 TaxID=2011010 RepID=UPI000BB92F49|nr:hypothetical protein [Bacillus sp. FJAT-45066]